MSPGEPPDNVYPLFSGIDTTPFGPTSQEAATDDGWSTTPEANVTDDNAANDRSQQRPFAGSRGNRRRRQAIRLPSPTGWIALALLAGAGLASARQILQPDSSARPAHPTSRQIYRAAIPATTPPRDKQVGTQRRHAPAQRLPIDRRYATSRRARARRHHAAQARAPASTARYVSSGSPGAPSAPVQVAPTTGTSTGATATSSASVTNTSQATSNPPAFGANGVLGPGSSPNG